MKKTTNNTQQQTAKTWIDAQTVNTALQRAAEKQAQTAAARNYRLATDTAAQTAAVQTAAARAVHYTETAQQRAAIAAEEARRAAAARAAEAAEIDNAIEADNTKNRRKRAFVVYRTDGTQQRIETTNTAAEVYSTNSDVLRVRQVVLYDTDYMEIARRVVYIVLKRGDAYSNGEFFSVLLRASWDDARKQDLIADAYTALVEHADEDAELQYKAMFAAVNHTIYINRKPYDGKLVFVTDWNNDAQVQNVTRTINEYVNKPSSAQRVSWVQYIATLTPRQRDILRYKAHGFSVRQIASALHLKSTRTVQEHIEAIRRKAIPYTQAARSSTEAQQIAQRAAAETDARFKATRAARTK